MTTIAVTVYSGPDSIDVDCFASVDVRWLTTLQVSSIDDLDLASEVVSVENKPDHPLYNAIHTRMEARLCRPTDAGVRYPNGISLPCK